MKVMFFFTEFMESIHLSKFFLGERGKEEVTSAGCRHSFTPQALTEKLMHDPYFRGAHRLWEQLPLLLSMSEASWANHSTKGKMPDV